MAIINQIVLYFNGYCGVTFCNNVSQSKDLNKG